MTSPADRTMRFSLRLSPEEMAACEDMQQRLGGERAISMNSVLADLIMEAYYYRTMPQEKPVLPVSPLTLGRVQWTADVAGITLSNALDMLVSRGLPHSPGMACDHTAPGQMAPAVPPAIRPPGTPVDGGPRYATPKPAAYPPVPPVTGQQPLDHPADTDTPGGTR